eukprot:3106081-Rhodomonas_salina.1
MEKCTITRAGMVGVAVIADGVASIRRCQILDSGDCGILVQDNARGTFTGMSYAIGLRVWHALFCTDVSYGPTSYRQRRGQKRTSRYKRICELPTRAVCDARC